MTAPTIDSARAALWLKLREAEDDLASEYFAKREALWTDHDAALVEIAEQETGK